jgi:uncharacterized membrane protein
LTRESLPSTRGRMSHEVALIAVFAALAVALGYLLASIPNVELITFTVFVAGVMLGRWRGALVGAVSATIYYGANPYGSSIAIPLLYAAQIGSLAITGIVGGLTGPLWRGATAERLRRVLPLLGGGLGLILTAVFQASMIVGLALSMPSLGAVGLGSALASNALFSLLHLAWNTAAFALLLPVLPRRLERALSRRLDR